MTETPDYRGLAILARQTASKVEAAGMGKDASWIREYANALDQAAMQISSQGTAAIANEATK